MRVDLHRCFLLHKKAYRETSLLLEVFSKSHGRVALVARGGASKKKLNRDLQAFTPLLIAWSGRGELGNLNNVEIEGESNSLSGDSLFSGYYVNELLIRLLHRHDPHSSLFEVYQSTIKQLSISNSLESVLRTFEKKLLEELGYGLILDYEINSGGKIFSAETYDYLSGEGPMLLSSVAIKPQGVKIQGSTLLSLQTDQEIADKEGRNQAKRLMRYLLAPLLGDKPLHSRRIFETMKK